VISDDARVCFVAGAKNGDCETRRGGAVVKAGDRHLKFDLVRPCAECPFRNDRPGYLTRERVTHIVSSLLHDASFTCHKTTRFSDDGKCVPHSDEQHCAGAAIFLERQDRPNQWMRWMERLGAYDRSKLDMEAPVFETLDEMKQAQPR
jgi:hypothetical protein